MHRNPALRLLVLPAVVLTLCLTSAAQSHGNSPLTNADLERMVKAGLSESTILRVMQVSETNFSSTPNALVELKHHHVPDSIIDAVLAPRSGALSNQFEAQPISNGGIEPGWPGTHKLPNVDAALRLNANTTAKLAVRQNHIKLERSGVPLFSLSWKDNGK